MVIFRLARVGQFDDGGKLHETVAREGWGVVCGGEETGAAERTHVCRYRTGVSLCKSADGTGICCLKPGNLFFILEPRTPCLATSFAMDYALTSAGCVIAVASA